MELALRAERLPNMQGTLGQPSARSQTAAGAKALDATAHTQMSPTFLSLSFSSQVPHIGNNAETDKKTELAPPCFLQQLSLEL